MQCIVCLATAWMTSTVREVPCPACEYAGKVSDCGGIQGTRGKGGKGKGAGARRRGWRDAFPPGNDQRLASRLPWIKLH